MTFLNIHLKMKGLIMTLINQDDMGSNEKMNHYSETPFLRWNKRTKRIVLFMYLKMLYKSNVTLLPLDGRNKYSDISNKILQLAFIVKMKTGMLTE